MTITIKRKISKQKTTYPPKSFANIRGIRTNLWSTVSFLLKRSPGILALCENNPNSSIAPNEFSVTGYLRLCRKDPRIHMHGFIVYIQEKSFNVKRIVSWVCFMCFRLSLLHSDSYLFSYITPLKYQLDKITNSLYEYCCKVVLNRFFSSSYLLKASVLQCYPGTCTVSDLH